MKSTANPRPRRWLWFWLGCAAAAALAVRLIQLDDRPVHTDEAVNAVIVGDMLSGQAYRYDPHDRHGPAFSFLAAPVCRLLGVRGLAGMEAWELRASTAAVGAATLLLLGLLPEAAPGAVLAAALFFGLGAPFVFYGRYAIHEPILIFATLLVLAAGWRFWREGRLRWAALAGLGLGIAECAKESALVTVGATVIAAAICSRHASSRRLWIAHRAEDLTPRRGRVAAEVAATAALLVIVAGYSSMGRNPAGLPDAIRAIPLLVARAAGQGHQKPWWAYLAWLAKPNPLCLPWFGWLVLGCGSLGAARSFSPRSDAPLMRLLAILGAILFIVYSATPYKTPWLMLNFLAPLSIVAGYGLAHTWNSPRGHVRRPAAILVAALAAGLLARESFRLCFRFADEPFNPYSYSPTSPDLARLDARLEQLAAASPHGRDLLIQVVAPDYWPLPWYLRKFPRVGYWGSLPPQLAGDAIIASPEESVALESRLGAGWRREPFGLRADILILLYTRNAPPHG